MTNATGRVTFREVFRIREFRALWSGELSSICGDQLARVALSVLVFSSTHSATLTGLTYAMTYIPSLLGGIFLTGFADRFPRRNVMVAVDLARMVLILLAALPGLPFPVLCVLVGGVSLLNPAFKAAQLAQLPDILTGERFIVGMGIRNVSTQSAQLLGFAGGGLLVATMDPHIALAIDAGTFLISALFLRFGVRARPSVTRKEHRPSFFATIGNGGKLVFGNPDLLTLVLFTWLIGITPVYECLAAPYAAQLGSGSTAVGLLLASDPFGSVLGVLIFTRWVPKTRRPLLIGPLTAAAGLPTLACNFQPNLALSMVLFILSGAFGSVALLQATSSLTLAVPDEQRAQTMGLSNSGLTTVMGILPLIAGPLADWQTPQLTVAYAGVATIVLATPLAIRWRKTFRVDPERWIAA